MRLPLKDYNDRVNSGRVHDEAMIARDLVALGMTRDDALRAAAEHVAQMYRYGREPGNIVSVGRVFGDNGGPLLDWGTE